MSRQYYVLLYVACLLWGANLHAQNTADYAVQLSVTTQNLPPQIRLHWPQDPNATGYTVYRKAATDFGWSSALATLAGTDTAFTDVNVAVGDAWEYRVSKSAAGYAGQGYCFAGIERPLQEDRGKVLLVVDTTYATVLAAAIERLQGDLWGDGWQVVRLNVDRNDSVTAVHNRIQAAWMADPTRVKSVFLLGHVPVPYSGNLNPDGHPDHQGAWPADGYYGEMDGIWTDNIVNNNTATRPQNQNILGDGKFDQSSIPSDIDLQVGRVDFANLPAFSEGEAALLQRYLDKDHAWRMAAFTAVDSAVIDDNFGAFGGEAFAASGWRNFAPMVGANHVVAGDFIGDLSAHDYLWAYGCGGGWYQGAGGVGATSDFAVDSLRGVFTMLFGSYHGDWDSDDNFMRAALATKGHLLSVAWAGRPHWHFQHMALGEPIGYAARLTQNNSFTYVGNYGMRFVHIALMGDPTLRMHVCPPPSNLSIVLANGGNAHTLQWSASTGNVFGYAIYRQDSLDQAFTRIGFVGLNTTTYTDSCMLPGDYRYMVRAEELRVGHSGSYFNLSQGLIDSISNTSIYATQFVLQDSLLCLRDSFTVPYTTVTDFCPGNLFTVEISDITGDFAQAQFIGTAQAVASGNIVCALPPFFPIGNGYRIRVNASLPSVVGTDNGADLQVQDLPIASFTYHTIGNICVFQNLSIGATSYLWHFDNADDSSTQASPTYYFPLSGYNTFSLIASNACGSDTAYGSVAVIGTLDPYAASIAISPNPTQGDFVIRSVDSRPVMHQVRVLDLLGHAIVALDWNAAEPLTIDTQDWPTGVYIVEARSKNKLLRRKLVVE